MVSICKPAGVICKVILETCYLTDEEKETVCRIAKEAGVDFVKTSTGFGTAGARIEDVRLFKRYIGEGVKIKAAGGVKTREDLEQFLEEGCERIGTSSALSFLAARRQEPIDSVHKPFQPSLKEDKGNEKRRLIRYYARRQWLSAWLAVQAVQAPPQRKARIPRRPS